SVFSTTYKSADLLFNHLPTPNRTVKGYYVQDIEHLFFRPGTSDWLLARSTYGRKDIIHIAKTKWLCEYLMRLRCGNIHKVEPSIDHSHYYPALSTPDTDRPIGITAMVRPSTPRRAP